MRYYRYIPFLQLRQEYRRRREIIGVVKEATVLMPVAAAVMWWILF